MNLSVLPDEEAAAQAAAEALAADLRGGGTFVLAGGSTPRRCYELMASLPVPWARVTILFGDERCVGPHDAGSNYLMARRAFLDQVSPASVHRIAGELGPEEAAARYDRVVAALRPLDVVLLGVGEDGHTASLFPGAPTLDAHGSAIPVFDSPKPPPERVSLTLEALREGRRVYFLTTGAAKQDAIRQAERGEVPSGMIPQAHWFVDREAAPA